jgi:hypothetical protein
MKEPNNWKKAISEQSESLAIKIQKMKKNSVLVSDGHYGVMICSACGYQDDCECDAYDKAISDVLQIIKEKE